MSAEDKIQALRDLQELANTLSANKDKNQRILQQYQISARDHRLAQLTVELLQSRYRNQENGEDKLFAELIGKRFILELLQIRYAGKSAYQVLEILHNTLHMFFKNSSLSEEEWREFYELAQQPTLPEILSAIPVEKLLTDRESKIVEEIAALGNLSEEALNELRSLILISDICNLHNIGIFLVDHFPSKWQEGMCLFFSKFE